MAKVKRDDFPYYDWDRTLSYNAPITMVIGERGVGKTYGIRKKAISICTRTDRTFVEIVRYQNDIDGDDGIKLGYFDKLIERNEFPDLMFKIEKHRGYWAKRTDDAPEWHLLMYFVALTNQQNLKRNTFARVRFIIFDEFILERSDRYHNYLKREFDALANLINTITRQDRATDKHPTCNVVLLGNAVDMINPYFSNIGIDRLPDYGYHWYCDRLYLLHYVAPDARSDAMLDNTIAGRMIKGSPSASVVYGNAFEQDSDLFIAKKTGSVSYEFGFEYDGDAFGIWLDHRNGIAYVDSNMQDDRIVFALTNDDRKINQIQIKRSNSYMQNLLTMYELGACRFESPRIRERFANAMRLFGLR